MMQTLSTVEIKVRHPNGLTRSAQFSLADMARANSILNTLYEALAEAVADHTNKTYTWTPNTTDSVTITTSGS